MVGVLTRLLGNWGTSGEQTQAQDVGSGTTPEQPNPTITLYGKIPPDLTNMSYIMGASGLYDAGFRPLDFVLLTFRQNGASAEVPAYIVGTYPMESYIGTTAPSETNDIPLDLSAMLREDEIKQSLRIEVLGGDSLLTKVLRNANMQGGEGVVKAEVSLRYRLQSKDDVNPAGRAKFLQGIVDAYPPSIKPYFNGIQLPLPMQLK